MRKLVPRWKNPDEYPLPETTSLDRWAWEFLSRNAEFNEVLARAREETKRLTASGEKLSIFWSQTPVGKVLQEWGIATPYLPEWQMDAPVSFKRFPRVAPVVGINGRDYQVTALADDRIMLVFDLSAPLPPQIERAKKMLEHSQRKLKGKKKIELRNSVRLFPIYLRVLDATSVSASLEDMMEQFDSEGNGYCSEEATIRNWKRAAEKLRDGGYRDIPKAKPSSR